MEIEIILANTSTAATTKNKKSGQVKKQNEETDQKILHVSANRQYQLKINVLLAY